MAEKSMVHLALRISKELNDRVEKCAKELRQKKHTLAQAAVEAAVEAIEQNNYSLVFPIRFDVTRVPMERSGSTPYPSHRDQVMRVEDGLDAQQKKKPKPSSLSKDTEGKLLEAFDKDLARSRAARPKESQ